MNKDQRFRHHEGDDGIVWLNSRTFKAEPEPEHEPSEGAIVLFFVVSLLMAIAGLIAMGQVNI